MITDLELLALLFARFCHDLSGPISAIRSGREFLLDEMADHQGKTIPPSQSVSPMYDDAMKLIDQSSQAAVARLQFFRHAYGALLEGGEANLLQLRQLAVQYFQYTAITLQWPDSLINAPELHMSRMSGKILLNMLVIIAKIVMQKGTLMVVMEKSLTAPYRTMITVHGAGEGIRIEDDIYAILQGRCEGVQFTPSNAQACYTLRLVQSLRGELQCVRRDMSVSLCYVCAEEPV